MTQRGAGEDSIVLCPRSFESGILKENTMSTPPPYRSLLDHAVPTPNPFPGSSPRKLLALSLNTHLPPLSAFTPTKDIRYHPLFQGLLFPWVWRVWTQRFTRAGHYFAAATLFFLAFSSVSLDQQFYVPLAYAAGLWTVALVSMWLGRPRVKLTTTQADRIRAGETLMVEIEVTVGKQREIGLFVLPDRLPPAVDAVPDNGAELPNLPPGETARVRLGLACRKRGVYQLRGFRVETAFPLGLMVAQQMFTEPRTLRVFPRFTTLARMDTPHGRRYQPGGTESAFHLGDSFEFIGSREYREGDPIRSIDWRATARLQRPVVREYQEEFLQRTAVILDTYAPMPPGLSPPPAFESAVSLTAAISDFLARSEYAIELFSAGPTLHTLAAGLGVSPLDGMLDLLAEVKAKTQQNADLDWDALEQNLSAPFSQITLIVCVFQDWDTARQGFVERLREYGASLKVVIVRDTPCTLPPGDFTRLTSAEIEAGVDEI
jgi:uncharacterized protein (DUF58 family)